MIRLIQISKSYGLHDLFSDVSLNINRGERIGLVGRNGHGKSTLLRLILRHEEPDSGSISTPKNYRVGHLEQHLRFTQPTLVDEACLGLAVDDRLNHWKVEKILTGLGFDPADFSKPPENFSGGFQVRLNLAKVLSSAPDLLLLDEPTNYLDILSIRWLVHFLRSWRHELVLITHDRGFMDQVITHTVGIHRKKIRKVRGPTTQYFDLIGQEEEVFEKTRINVEKKRRQTELFIQRFRAKARLAGMVQSRVKALQKQERMERLEETETLDFSFRAAHLSAKWILEADQMSFSYSGKPPLLIDGFSMTIGRTDRICIVGKNGKGKSTLLGLLAAELQPVGGRVKSHRELQWGFFGQTNIDRLSPDNTILEEISSVDAGCSLQQVRDIAGALMFEGDMALKKISVLSGGERSRVMLGKILAKPSHLLLLDEPTNHLDLESSEALLAAIEAFSGACVIVTHNEMFLHSLATRLIVFDRQGAFVYDGSYQEFLDNVGWQEENVADGRTGKGRDNKKGRSVNRKSQRRARAELQKLKARELGDLRDRVGCLEAAIEKNERQMSENHRLMVAASAAADVDKIAELSKGTQEIEDRLPQLYDELDAATQEYELKTKELELKMNASRTP